MSSISGFRIDEGVTFAFNTGGAVPPPSGGNTPVNAVVSAKSAGLPIIGNLSVIEEE